MPARVLLGAFVTSHPQVPRSQDQIPPCLSQNGQRHWGLLKKRQHSHYSCAKHVDASPWFLNVEEQKGISPALLPPLLGSSALKFLCSLKTYSHHPTSPTAKQPSPWGRVAPLMKGSKWTLPKSLPDRLSIYKHSVGFTSPATSFISHLYLLPQSTIFFYFSIVDA